MKYNSEYLTTSLSVKITTGQVSSDSSYHTQWELSICQNRNTLYVQAPMCRGVWCGRRYLILPWQVLEPRGWQGAPQPLFLPLWVYPACRQRSNEPMRGVGSVLARSNRAANYPRDGGTVSLSSFPSSLGLQKSGVSWWERGKGLLCPSFQHVPSAMGDYLPIEHRGSTSTVSLPALSCVFCDCGEAEFSSCVSCAFNSNFPCLGLASRGQLLWEFVPEKGDLSWGTWVCHEL